MTEIMFRVDGIPKAQPRPRAFARQIGGKAVARVYESGTAESWKSLIAAAALPHRPPEPLEGPLMVSIEFHMPRPKRLMRKRDPDGPVWHTAKPDRDNLDKAVLDALKTIGMYRDDAQVCSGSPRKFYHAKHEIPHAIITICGLFDDNTEEGPPCHPATAPNAT